MCKKQSNCKTWYLNLFTRFALKRYWLHWLLYGKGYRLKKDSWRTSWNMVLEFNEKNWLHIEEFLIWYILRNVWRISKNFQKDSPYDLQDLPTYNWLFQKRYPSNKVMLLSCFYFKFVHSKNYKWKLSLSKEVNSTKFNNFVYFCHSFNQY